MMAQFSSTSFCQNRHDFSGTSEHIKQSHLLYGNDSFLGVFVNRNLEDPQAITIHNFVLHLRIGPNVCISSFNSGYHRGYWQWLWNVVLVRLCEVQNKNWTNTQTKLTKIKASVAASLPLCLICFYFSVKKILRQFQTNGATQPEAVWLGWFDNEHCVLAEADVSEEGKDAFHVSRKILPSLKKIHWK